MALAQKTAVDFLKDYERGERLRAADVNSLIQIAKAQMQLEGEMFGDIDARSIMSRGLKSQRRNFQVPFFNMTDEGVPGGGVCLPVDYRSLIDELGLDVEKPGSDGSKQMIVHDIAEETPQDGYGWAAWGFLGAWCLYDESEPLYLHDRWGTKEDEFKLFRPGSGCWMFLGNSMQIGSAYYGRFCQIPQVKKFVVSNGVLSQGGTVTVERVRRKADNSGWERSGETYTAYDFFMNTSDDDIPIKTAMTTVSYEGLEVIDAMYCVENDWIED